VLAWTSVMISRASMAVYVLLKICQLPLNLVEQYCTWFHAEHCPFGFSYLSSMLAQDLHWFQPDEPVLHTLKVPKTL
jgi:hypothetical protein